MKFDLWSHFGSVITNEDANNTVVKFTIRGTTTGIPIITPRYEDMDTYPYTRYQVPYFGTRLENCKQKMKCLHNKV